MSDSGINCGTGGDHLRTGKPRDLGTDKFADEQAEHHRYDASSVQCPVSSVQLDSIADRAAGWLGSSLHVKGDITGTEDLLIDGSVDGLLRLDEWKLTVGSDGEAIRLASPSEISGVPTPPR